jgi:hypothetical protein
MPRWAAHACSTNVPLVIVASQKWNGRLGRQLQL